MSRRFGFRLVLCVRVYAMRTGISFTVSAVERQRLQAIVAAPRSPQSMSGGRVLCF